MQLGDGRKTIEICYNNNMVQFYTYLHCKPDGDPFYVGKGKNKRSHDFFNGRNKWHKSTVDKYGKDNVIIYVFHCESEDQAIADEIQQISQLRYAGYKLCNLTNGGEGMSGIIPSQETRDKQSKLMKGRKFTAEHCAKIAASHRGKKHPRSKEWQEKIVASSRGRKRTTEEIQKTVLALTGRTRPEYVKAKISEKLKGYKSSEETRLKQSLAAKARWNSQPARPASEAVD